MADLTQDSREPPVMVSEGPGENQVPGVGGRLAQTGDRPEDPEVLKKRKLSEFT